MQTQNHVKTIRVAITAIFSSLYTILSFLGVFPVVGLGGFISAGAIIGPVFGLVLGANLGFLTIAIGGLINSFLGIQGPFGPLSFLPHASSAFFAGLLKERKKWFAISSYILFFIIFAFYPDFGPIWLYPPFIWLHLIALAILILPLQSKESDFGDKMKVNLNPNVASSKVFYTILLIVFVSLMFGHIIGNIMFETVFLLVKIPEFGMDNAVNSMRASWQMLTFQYAIERLIMLIIAIPISLSFLAAFNYLHINLSDQN